MPPPSPSLRDLSDELVGEILVRLPPDDPACLLRASLACKAWRRILADRALRRRLHRAPPVVGFLRIGMGEGDMRYGSRYTPNNGAASSRRPAAPPPPAAATSRCGSSSTAATAAPSSPRHAHAAPPPPPPA